VAWLLQRLQPLAARHPLTLLALERARRMRSTAAIAVGGVVASLSLAVALIAMGAQATIFSCACQLARLFLITKLVSRLLT
jgi:hypothetical protein